MSFPNDSFTILHTLMAFVFVYCKYKYVPVNLIMLCVCVYISHCIFMKYLLGETYFKPEEVPILCLGYTSFT
jgi:hypothetical protein